MYNILIETNTDFENDSAGGCIIIVYNVFVTLIKWLNSAFEKYL